MSVATLAGVGLLDAETVSWQLSQGVEPYARAFQCHKRDAKAILAASEGREVELYLKRASGIEETYRGLSVLNVQPTDHPDISAVLVVDRRYWWDRELVAGDFNVRRRSGELRLVDGALERIPPVPDVTYAKYSLENEQRPWVAETFISHVMRIVTKNRFALDGVDFSKASTLEDLTLRDPGSSAMRRALALVPGLAVYLDADGIARLTVATGGAEEAQLKSTGPPVEGPTLAIHVDHSRTRPKAIEVFFPCEDETRFDALEGISYTTDSREPRIFENVIPLPDDVTINGKLIVRGTWWPINQGLLDVWNSSVPPIVTSGSHTFTLPPFSFAIIRRLFLAPGHYTAYSDAGDQEDRIWAKRVQAILQHFRQTYRLPRRWADRCYSFQPTRLAIVDPENGTRAPADVYLDHCVIPSQRRIFALKKDDPANKAAANQLAWPIGAAYPWPLSDGELCSGAAVLVADPDCFVFKILVKPTGGQRNDVDTVLPSAMSAKENGEDTEIPSIDPRVARGLFLLHRGRLASRHRMSTVLSLAPAVRGLDGLYKISVGPSEAKEFLPPSAAKKVGECKGPTLQLYISDVPARSAWDDAAAREIEQSIIEGKPRNPARILDPEHMANVAKAAAASVYNAWTDRWEGTRTVAYSPGRKPVGRISSVKHRLAPNGDFVTELEMLPQIAPADFVAFLPEATRKKFFRKVQP